MPIFVARISAELEQVYCPFTGKPIHGDDGVNAIRSLLFVYYGDAGDYGYVSHALVTMLTGLEIECGADDVPLSPEELAKKLNVDRAFILEIDAGWNGINSYGFVVRGNIEA